MAYQLSVTSYLRERNTLDVLHSGQHQYPSTGPTYLCWKNWLHANFSTGQLILQGFFSAAWEWVLSHSFVSSQAVLHRVIHPYWLPHPTPHWASENPPSSDGHPSKYLNYPNNLQPRVPWKASSHKWLWPWSSAPSGLSLHIISHSDAPTTSPAMPRHIYSAT